MSQKKKDALEFVEKFKKLPVKEQGFIEGYIYRASNDNSKNYCSNEKENKSA